MSTLVPVLRAPECIATVIVPVSNEEFHLRGCLTSLLGQTAPLPSYEVLVLLNNCTDSSPAIAYEFQKSHPNFALRIVERQLPKSQANVGTARRLLMDEASRRLPAKGAILSTDGDTIVAPNWVQANLALLNVGADVVGGEILLRPDDYARLPKRSRQQHEADDAYQRAATHLESLLDPDPFDPWPRHHHHFGASLACLASLYRRVGGLPAVDCLEDMGFIQKVVRADAKLRHSPDVKVVTAARTTGRARIGLSSQLREWETAPHDPLVDSAAFYRTYFRTRLQLRKIWRTGSWSQSSALSAHIGITNQELARRLADASTFGELHDALDLRGRLWRRMPQSLRVMQRSEAIEQIRQLTESLASERYSASNSLPATLAAASSSQ